MRKLALGIALSSCLFLTACGSNIHKDISVFYSMDTIITVTLYNTKDSEMHFSKIKEIYQEINDASDDYNESITNTSVYELNNARSALVSDTLIDILNESIQLYEDTNGYFNPFMGRLTHKWKEAIKAGEVLDKDIVQQELEILENTSLKIEGNRVTILGDGNIDLGGIAKGYATLMAKKYLKEQGITSYFISAGKSSISLGDKAGGKITVGLSHPYDIDKYIGILKEKNIDISSSSLENQHKIINDRVYHHLINPFNGIPSNTFDSIFVINDNPCLGDAYSTALFNMSLEDAIAFSLDKNISILLYKDNSILYKSEGVELYE